MRISDCLSCVYVLLFVREHPFPTLVPHIEFAPVAHLWGDDEFFVGRRNHIPSGIGASGSACEVGKPERHEYGPTEQAGEVGCVVIAHHFGDVEDIFIIFMEIEIMGPTTGTTVKIRLLVSQRWEERFNSGDLGAKHSHSDAERTTLAATAHIQVFAVKLWKRA